MGSGGDGMVLGDQTVGVTLVKMEMVRVLLLSNISRFVSWLINVPSPWEECALCSWIVCSISVRLSCLKVTFQFSVLA